MSEFFKKIKKWKQKRLARRANKDVLLFWRAYRYFSYILIFILFISTVFLSFDMYKKYVNLRGVANMQAVKVNENDIKFQGQVDKIFKNYSLLETTTQIDIDAIESIYEKTSKNDSIVLLYDMVISAWKEYSQRLLLEDKISNNKSLKQGEVDDYVKSFNDLNKLLVDVESSQKETGKNFIGKLTGYIQDYNQKLASIEKEKKDLEENKLKVHSLANSTVELKDFVNKEYSSFVNWATENGIKYSVEFFTTENKSLNNIIKGQYPRDYKSVRRGSTIEISVYAYEAPSPITIPSESISSTSDKPSNSENPQSNPSSSTTSSSNKNSEVPSTNNSDPSSSATIPSSSEDIDETLNRLLDE